MMNVFALILVGLALAGSVHAVDNVNLPDDPEKAWGQVESARERLSTVFQHGKPSDQEWPAFVVQLKTAVGPVADTACAFLAKFPKDERAGDAREVAVESLLLAVLAGDAMREDAFKQLLDATAADATLPDTDRLQVLTLRAQLPVMKKSGAKVIFGDIDPALETERQQAEHQALLAARELMPKSATLYRQWLELARQADSDDAKIFAREITTSESAPVAIKTAAQDLLDGRKPHEVGKPVDLKFTDVDGREVDLAKLKGKVVLIDFWATWCGPCVGEIPHVKAAYEKFHGQGFEIIGISLDENKGALAAFTKENDMPWPQSCAGNGWDNPLVIRFGVKSIPEMWLVDKSGNLRDVDAQEDLAGKVAKLLAETP